MDDLIANIIKQEVRIEEHYKDGSNNLAESYFGIGQDSHFLSQEQQKRLLKTNENL